MDTSAKPSRRNASKTRARILAAAQQAFSELGYSQAGIRDVAAIAGVSSTLLLRYYGSKAGLFEAALIESMRVEGLFEKGREAFGEHLTGLLSDANFDTKPPSMIVLATGDADAREVATKVTAEYGLSALAKWLGPPDARARAVAITILSMGYVLCTRQLPLTEGIKGADKKIAKWMAQTLQAIVDQS